MAYRKSSINPLGGLFVSNTFEGGGGGLLETEGFLEGGGLFNLAKMVVLALHKELESKVEKLKYKKLKVMRPRIKSKSNLLTRKYTIQDQSK